MYYIIYQITNLLNGHFYIGYHSTLNLEDEYMGSGKIIRKAIKKYGKENFSKKILYLFPSKEEALSKEKELVNEDFIKRKDTYNIKYGGEGGWEHTFNDPKRIEGIRRSFKEGKSIGWPQTKEWRKENGKSSFKGKKHTKKSKEKIGKAHIISENVLFERLEDLKNIEKRYGWKNYLSKKWGISHTQVNRFIKKYGL